MDAPDRAALTEPHVSNRILRAFTVHLGERLGPEFVREVVEEAGLDLDSLADTEGWVSEAFTDAFARAVARRLYGLDGPPPYDHPLWQVWRDVGRANLDREVLGPIWHVLRALGAPSLFYGRLPELVSSGNHLTRVEVLEKRPGWVVLRFSPRDAARPDRPWYCWNRLGVLEGAPALWGLPQAVVEHPTCAHTGSPRGTACVYRVRYRERPLVRALPTVGAVSATGLAGAAAGLLAGGGMGPWVVAGLSAGIAAGTGRAWLRERAAGAEEAERLRETLAASDGRYQSLWAERQALRRALLVNRKIAGYVPADAVEQIVSNPDLEVELGGRRTHGAVLFVDIVGFTPRCERSEPERVVEDLNRYFQAVDPVIAAWEGVIDKRMGDGIMVVFTARGADDPAGVRRRALGCALDLLRAVPKCNESLVAAGSEPFRVRLGLAAGPLVQGTMGSDVRLEYTVVGDVVNLAARLEGQATPMRVMATKEVVEGGVPGGRVVGERRVKVRGREEEVEVVEVEGE